VYLEGIRRLSCHTKQQLEPPHIVVFEDSPTGARAGAAAGCRVIGVGRSASRAALRAAGAVATLDDYRGLTSVDDIERLLND
jgi:beta-phosphoglucomutase-like phosphatase (HAD superfamily)